MTEAPKPCLRWWPASVILLLAAAAWGWIWFVQDAPRQQQNIGTGVVLIAAIALLLVWILFLSGIRWRHRFACAAATFLLLGGLAASLEIRGVTGDLVPVLAWRWTPRHTHTGQGSGPPAPVTTTNVTGSFPQILGPDRNGRVSGLTLDPDWSGSPPRLLWKRTLGPAWSGFAAANGRAFTMEQRAEEEHVVCYDLLTGQELWSHGDPAHFATTLAGEGPRTVPTLASDRLFTVGATGILNCLAATNGALLWSTNFITANGSTIPEWGVSGSPLIHNGRVIVSAGGSNGRSLVAYDTQTGTRIWSGGDDRAHYSSPKLFRFHGQEQIVIFNRNGLASHNPADGSVLWEYGWRKGHPHIAVPLDAGGNRLLVSSGYGTGSELVQIGKQEPGGWAANQVWKSNRLKSKFANYILLHNHVYGLDDGTLVCLNLESGDLLWKDGRYGHGQMLLAGDLIVLMAEQGDVVLIQPSPAGRIEVARLPVFADKTWNPPALAGPYLLVRNDKEAACYRLPVKEPTP